MTKQRDTRKSNFVEVESSEATDRFDLVRNGQNLKISQANLVNDFGVSGPLQTRGEATAVPVLEVIANVNYIRNILGGSGISASLSAQDGVRLDHNFTVDTDGVPIMINATSDSPTIRSIQAGAGINVAGAGGVIQIASTEIPASTKTVVVYSIDDFLDNAYDVTGDVITLLPDIEYRLQDDVSSAYRFVFGNNTVISGADENLVELEFTGIGIMLTAADVNIKIKDIRITCSTATLFDASSTTGFHQMRMRHCNIVCDNVGTFTDLSLMFLFNVSFNMVYTQGFIFVGSFDVVLLDTIGATMSSGAGNLFDLGTAVFEYFTVDKGLFNINTTGYVITGTADSGNINSTGLGAFLNSRNFGTTFPPSDTIFHYDDRWESFLNTRIPNSYDVALSTHAGATIAIAAALTPVIVGATWASHNAYRFTPTVGGRWTYTGKGTSVEIVASISGTVTSGTDFISFFIYVNGVQETNSRVIREFVSTSVGNLSMVWEVQLDTDDYIELWVQNDDTDVDFEVSAITMRIRS